MKLRLFILFIFTAVILQAQDKSYDTDVKKFIELNGTMNQYQAAVNQLLDMFREQYKDQNVKEEVWIEVNDKAQNSLEGLSNDLIVVYKKFFTREEIIELNKLFEKEVAQKYINNVIQITDASQDPSIVWSRSLFNQLKDHLHEKGYIIPTD